MNLTFPTPTPRLLAYNEASGCYYQNPQTDWGELVSAQEGATPSVGGLGGALRPPP